MVNCNELEKIPTGIAGFDDISFGGLPTSRTTLVSGTSGSAKTIFSVQFLTEGVKKDQNGVFVTFEESVNDIRRNTLSLGQNIEEMEKEGKWAFVDVSPDPNIDSIEIGSYDFNALIVRIKNAVKKVNAKRITLDSIGSIFNRFENVAIIRRELFRISNCIREMGLTAIMTFERTEEYGPISRYGVEEFVCDNVIVLRNILENERRRRTIEILKFRGANHQRGEYPFTIAGGDGIVILPLSSIELDQNSSNVKLSSGIKRLDDICSGGFLKDSVVLLSGATGAGKTLTTIHFLHQGILNGERVLLLAFEESKDQMFRNADGWGMDLRKAEEEGLIKVICAYPENYSLEDHLLRIKKAVKEFKPTRLALDSLTALERASSLRGFREFVIGMTSFVKQQEITSLLTSTTETLMGGASVTEGHISTITDMIILLRYVEFFGEMRRGITVLKMRGSAHEKMIFEYDINSSGMNIIAPFKGVTGILSGNPVYSSPEELDRIKDLFKE